VCQKVLYEVYALPADFLAIASQGLVNTKYRGIQILPRAYPSQRGIRAGFCCLAGKAIATEHNQAILVNSTP
jgi:hypothetical protein